LVGESGGRGILWEGGGGEGRGREGRYSNKIYVWFKIGEWKGGKIF
jgi:hypothetical protein